MSRALLATMLRRIALAGVAAATLGGCAGSSARPGAGTPRMRLVGSRVIYVGLQPTYWWLYCPTDTASELRGRCEYRRADGTTAAKASDAGAEQDEASR